MTFYEAVHKLPEDSIIFNKYELDNGEYLFLHKNRRHIVCHDPLTRKNTPFVPTKKQVMSNDWSIYR